MEDKTLSIKEIVEIFEDRKSRCDAWNNLNPDRLHRDYLLLNERVVMEDGSTISVDESLKSRRGRKKGSVGRCGYCGETGHYRNTCEERKRHEVMEGYP